MPKLINKVIRTMILSDICVNLGWGFLSPVFAIFILERVTQSSLAQAATVAGLASLFYWVPKSFFQIPIAMYLDRHHGEKDDFWFMIIGFAIVALVPIGYIFSTTPWHIYLFQVIYAAGMAMCIPSWLAIFTRHIDKGQEAFEWSMESAAIGTGAGIAGGLSGILVGFFGFQVLFIFVSGFTILATILMLYIRDKVFIRDGHFVFPREKPIVEP
jgi:hypothetical protein